MASNHFIASILFSDIEGFTATMQIDEAFGMAQRELYFKKLALCIVEVIFVFHNVLKNRMLCDFI